MQITKDQHYVPRFYLKNFSQNRKSIGMLRREGYRLVENASIRQVAYRDYLYGKDGNIENWLSKCEGKWSKVVRFLLGQAEEAAPVDLEEYYALLLHFVAISIARTARVADGTREFMDYLGMMFDEVQASGKELAFDRDEFFEDYDRPNAKSIEIADETIAVLGDLRPLTIINDTTRGFLSTDNPVVQYNLLYTQRNYTVNYGLSSGGLIIFLPLNEKISFCLYDAEVYSTKSLDDATVTISSINQINELNKLFTMNGYDCLFFGKMCEPDYIRSISKFMRAPQSFVREYPILGSKNTILRFGDDSIHKSFQIPIFKIREPYKDIALPDNLGGLQRKSATQFMNEYKALYGLDELRPFRVVKK